MRTSNLNLWVVVRAFRFLRALSVVLLLSAQSSELKAAPSNSGTFLANEQLVVVKPDGYKLGYQAANATTTITEWVPQSETVENWTEMLTVQILRRLKGMSPAQFRTSLEKKWSSDCKDSEFGTIKKGVESHYNFSLSQLNCPLNPKTNKPELTWMKVIEGNDALYVVQQAYRYPPALEAMRPLMQFFGTVAVCDSRLKDRPCPQLQHDDADRPAEVR